MLSLWGKSKRYLGGSLGRGCPPIGLDLGSDTLRAAQLTRIPGGSPGDESRYRVVTTARAKRIPDPEAVAGAPARLDGPLTAELKGMLDRGGFAGRSLVMGLDPPDLVAVAISLPLGNRPLDDPQIRSALSFELSRHIGFPAEQAEIRSWPLPGGGPMAPTVMGVAAHRDLVADRYRVAASAGYRCRRIDSGACALVRCCSVFSQPPPGSIWGVLDAGRLASRLVVAVDNVPVLQRELSTGGAILTYHVAEHLKLSLQAAERLKRDYGIVDGFPTSEETALPLPPPPAPLGQQASLGTPAGEQGSLVELEACQGQVTRLIFRAVRRSLAVLAVEVEKSMAYAMHLYGELPVSTLYLAGGGSGLRGLDQFLSQEIGIEVVLADPLRASGAEQLLVRGESGGAWARAVGLALLGLGG